MPAQPDRKLFMTSTISITTSSPGKEDLGEQLALWRLHERYSQLPALVLQVYA